MKKILYPLILFISTVLPNNTTNNILQNDAPIWIDIPEQFIGEDCLYGCEDGLFSIDLEPFFSDPDDDILTLLEPILLEGEVEQAYVLDYTLYMEPIDDYFGNLDIQLTITDEEFSSSANILINIESINDIPFFSSLGDIIIDEDQIYQENWAFDIYGGPENENQDVTFEVNFENIDLIEDYSMTSLGLFTIEPLPNANGTSIFSVYITDDQLAQSEILTYTLTINSINDIPVINDQSFIIYDEDCGSETCDDSNKLILNADMFDIYDVEDQLSQLTLFIDHDNIEQSYITDGDLGILINQDYNFENEGVLQVPIYVTDSEGDQSDIFICDIVITSVNDAPYFSNLGDIVIDEDQIYQQQWAFDISAGAYNEDQGLTFFVLFDN